MEEKYCLCALNRIFGFEPKIAHALLENLGSAGEVFDMEGKEIDSLLGPYSRYKGKICRRAVEESAREIEGLSRNGISFIGLTEDGYPDILRECDDAPVGLYVRGRTPASELFAPHRRIGVVGTRDLSPYGQEWCRKIVQNMGTAPEKPAVISGLALGTDICAHIQALDCGLPTIAVMATGPEAVYPYRHRGFADRIADTHGCALITDYPPGTAPLAIHFLRRNRIIAGLSDALVLIESRIKGGGMMTSRLAFSYNRDVYALPGRVDDTRSQGCNLLIKEKIAEAVDSAEGLMKSLGLRTMKRPPAASDEEILRRFFPEASSSGLLDAMVTIMKAIRKNRAINLDDLSAATGLDYGKTVQLTGLLQTEGIISVDLLQRCSINIGIYR